MATPLFIASSALLQQKLRLSGVDGDALAIFEDCLEAVRIGLYDALPNGRVDQIKATAYAEGGTTADQLMRARANRAEVTWMRLLLLRRLPLLFLDASDKTREEWNQEGLTREAGKEADKEIARLEAELGDLLTDLLGDAQPDTSTINVYVGEPCRPVPRPGDTAFGRRDFYGRRTPMSETGQ